MKLHASGEDYLEAILVLHKKTGMVRSCLLYTSCGNKTRTKVNPDTILKRFPLFCPKCGTEHIVDVQGQSIILSEPDAKTQSR